MEAVRCSTTSHLLTSSSASGLRLPSHFPLSKQAHHTVTRWGKAALRSSPTPRSRSRRAVQPMAVSEGFSHRPAPRGPSPEELRSMSEEQRQALVDEAAAKIKSQTEQRALMLREQQHKAHLDHELKFGKILLSQGQLESAIAHFNKVIQGSGPQTYHFGEAKLQKATCLQRLGRDSEAKAIYESLIQFRAPFPHIKRRAAQALVTGDASEEADEAAASGQGVPKSPEVNEYMYRMFMSGFGHYAPTKKYVETPQEKAVMSALPWAILLMAPALLAWLLLVPR